MAAGRRGLGLNRSVRALSVNWGYIGGVPRVVVRASTFLFGLGVCSLGCATRASGPYVPPAPSSISQADPGGDSSDPHAAALRRQMREGWGQRTDKDNQLLVPLLDRRNWKRVRYWGLDHFTGFRYGDDHHLATVAFIQDVPAGEPVDGESCNRRFEQWAQGEVDDWDVHIESRATVTHRWRDNSLVVHKGDGSVPMLFSREGYSVAWAVYPAYTDACLIYAVAVAWDGHQELAQAVRDRWAEEAFQRLRPKTEARPFRK